MAKTKQTWKRGAGVTKKDATKPKVTRMSQLERYRQKQCMPLSTSSKSKLVKCPVCHRLFPKCSQKKHAAQCIVHLQQS